jgi:hypothetical protein
LRPNLSNDCTEKARREKLWESWEERGVGSGKWGEGKRQSAIGKAYPPLAGVARSAGGGRQRAKVKRQTEDVR